MPKTPWTSSVPASTLREAIDSLRQQTEPDFELVIVDDGSTDDGVALVESIAACDRRVRLIRQGPLGIVAALQRGIQESRGRFLARMDADDVCLPERLGCQRAFLEQHFDIGLVSCLVDHLAVSAEQDGYRRHVDWLNRVITSDEICRARFIESPLAHPSVLFRRELVDRYGGYRAGDFPEDYELWLRWLEAGVRMEKIPRVLLRWRDLPQRLSRTDARYDLDSFFRVKAGYLARWLAVTNPHHPRVWIWGASRLARRRAELLFAEGISPEGFIEVKPGRVGTSVLGVPVVSRECLPPVGSVFVVVFVSARNAREEIRAVAQRQGYREGEHFVFAA
ncbi:MAG TPA: glycosyltransferase [Candidatus Ozemobacteraceae bacterium]|nr:glycosyltransferase [Candidatus Ozemobacteraceae bacterium]